MVDKVSDKTLNDYISNHIDPIIESQSVIKRLNSQTIKQIIYNDSSNSPDFKKFINQVVRQRKISEEEGQELIRNNKLPRSALITLKAIYHPDDFIAELSKIDPEDLVLSIKNYQYGIEAFEGTNPIFFTILKAAETNADVRNMVLPKVPVKDRMSLFVDMITNFNKSGAKFGLGQSEKDRIYKYLIETLISFEDILTGDDFEAKRYIVSLLPSDFNLPSTLAEAIVFSTDVGQLRQLYIINNDQIKNYIKSLLVLLGEIQEPITTSKLSGASANLISDTEAVLHCNTEEDLLKLRRATKSRGVKTLIDRKLNRMRRLNAAVGA